MHPDSSSSAVTLLVVLGVAGLISTLATAWVRRFALVRGLVDKVTSSRKIHVGEIPRLGGIAMALGVTVSVLAGVAVDESLRSAISDRWPASIAIAGSLAAILIVGIVDDLRGVRARTKLVVQVLAATGLVLAGRGIHAIEVLPGLSVDLGMLGGVITILWIVGVINAVNLIDGMDGLAAGISLVAAMALAVLALANGDVPAAVLPIAVAGAVAGFLIFNWHPASIFMGDTGSMMLGLLLAVSALRITGSETAPTRILVCVLVLAVPLVDTALAFFRRLMVGRSPFSADKEHLHHRILLHLGTSHQGAVLLLHGVAASLAVVGIGLARATAAQASALLLMAALTIAAVLWRLGYLNALVRQNALRHRNARLRDALRKTGRDLRLARDLDSLWSAVEPLSEVLGVAKLEFHLDIEGSRRSAISFQRIRSAGDSTPLVVQVPVRSSPGTAGKLIAIWRNGLIDVDRDFELAMEWTARQIERRLQFVTRAEAEVASVGSVVALPSRGSAHGDVRVARRGS